MSAGEVPKSIRASLYIDGKPAEGTLKDVRQAALGLRRELDGLVVGTDAFKKKAAELASVNKVLSNVKDDVNGLGGAFGWLKTEIGKLGAVAVGVFGFQFVTQQFQSIIAANAKLSDSLAQVRQTSGLTEDEVRNLNNELKKIDTRTARAELLKIAEIGGQFNVPKEQLKAFVEQVDRINVVLGSEFKGGAGEITQQLALLRNNFTDIKSDHIDVDLGKIGNALIVLAQEGAATAPVMTEFAKRLSPLITTAHLSTGAILGLSATLQELAVDPERGGTAVVKLFSEMSSNVYGFAQVAGVAGDAFKKMLDNNPLEAFTKVLEGFKKGGNNISVMNGLLKELDITGTGAREALVKLSTNTDLLTQRTALATDALTKQDAITAQFGINNNTFGATLDKLGKKFAQISGNATLQNFFSSLVVLVSQGIDVFGKYIGVIGAIIKLVIAGTVAYGAYNAIVLIATITQSKWIAALLETEFATNLVSVAQTAWTVVLLTCQGRIREAEEAMVIFNATMEANPIGLVVAAILGLVAAFYLFKGSATESIDAAISRAQELTDKFNEQSKEVGNLTKNIQPLLDRYDELKTKGKLTRDEQAELKKIIGQISSVIPDAITQFDNYGNALGINTKKAREFIDAQKAMLSYQNKTAIGANVDARNEITAERQGLVNQLNRGTTTSTVGGDLFTGAQGTEITRNLTSAEKQAIQARIKALVLQTKGIDDTIRGLSGSYLDAGQDKPAGGGGNGTIAQLKLTDMTVGDLRKHVEDLNAQLDTLRKGSAEYVKVTNELRQANAILKQVDKDSGKGTGGADPQKKVNEFLLQSKALSQKLKEFIAQELADEQTKNDKEVASARNKFDQMIAAEQAFIDKSKKNPAANKNEIQKHQDEIDKLKIDKENHVNEVIKKQQQDLTDAIKRFQDEQAGNLGTELQRRTAQINAFYDDQLKNLSKGDYLGAIEITAARYTDIIHAELEEEKKLVEEKERLNDEYDTITHNRNLSNRAKIIKKYDQELRDLEKSFDDKLKTTQAYQDAVDAIKRNKDAALKENQEDEDRKWKEAAVDTAKEVNDAIFSVAANNRQVDTDNKIKALEDQKNIELSNADLTESGKAAINDKYAKQEAEIKLKAWKANQAAAVEQAIINGALAVTKTFAELGWPAGIIGAAAALGTTAAQIIEIEGQEPPQFAQGGMTDTDPSGYVSKTTLFRNSASGRPFVAGEAGKEWIAPNWMVKSPRYSNIIGMLESARQEKRAYAAGGYNGQAQASVHIAPADNSELLDEMRKMRQAIQDQQVIIQYQYFKREFDKIAQIEANANAK